MTFFYYDIKEIRQIERIKSGVKNNQRDRNGSLLIFLNINHSITEIKKIHFSPRVVS
jgi:hypothetical protein